VVDGALAHRERVLMMSTKASHETLEVGVISPEPTKTRSLGVGEVGYLITGVKDVRQSRVGDTVTSLSRPASHDLGGYRPPKPMVFAGLYPIDGADYPELREALDKLPSALGFGLVSLAYCIWRSCGSVWSANLILI
jgi:GTP-binding protein LepA